MYLLAPSFTNILFDEAKSVIADGGNTGVAVTPVRFDPSPLNEPLNEPLYDPDKFELAPVNCIEGVPDIIEPLSVKLELAKATLFHFGIH